MANVLVLNKSVNNALESAMYAAEQNDFEKAISLLEYVKEYKQKYDEVIVEYMLLYSYYATNQLEKAGQILNKIKKLTVNDPHIRQVISEIEAELLLNEINEIENEESSTDFTIKNMITMIIANMENNGGFNKIVREYSDDPFIYTLFIEKDNQEGIDSLYIEALELHADLLALSSISNIDEKKQVLILILNRITLNGFFWQLLTAEEYNRFINIDDNDQILVDAFIAISLHFSKYTTIDRKVIKDVTKLNYKDQKFNTFELFLFSKYFQQYYDLNTQNLFYFYKILILVIGLYKITDSTYLYSDRVVATTMYAINDAIDNHDNEKVLQKEFKYTRDQLTEELVILTKYYKYLD